MLNTFLSPFYHVQLVVSVSLKLGRRQGKVKPQRLIFSERHKVS